MLFRKKIDRSCGYCIYGAHMDEGQILCPKKGMRTTMEKCRKFKYDPCKRIPVKAKPVDFCKFEKEDYSL